MDTLSISHGSHGGTVWEAVGIPTVPTTPYRGWESGGKFSWEKINRVAWVIAGLWWELFKEWNND